MKTNKGLLLWQSIMAGAQVLAGVAALSDMVGKQAAGLVVVSVAVLQAATATYVHGLATPTPPSPPAPPQG